jgi:SAM-dependent methyltransferase
MSSTAPDDDAIKAFYDAFGLETGLDGWRHPNWRHERLRLELVEQLAGARGLRILDIGCGAGIMSSYLCAYGSVTGIDLSGPAIELAQLVEPRAEFKVGTLAGVHNGTSYDLVTLFDVLEHVPTADRGSLFSDIRRSLAPGGHVLLSTPHPEYTRWLHAERPDLMQIVEDPVHLSDVIDLANEIGLTVVSYKSYWVDQPGRRQYQLIHLEPLDDATRSFPGAATPVRKLTARLTSAANPLVPRGRAIVRAGRIAASGRIRPALWMLGLAPMPFRRPPS